MNYKEAKNSINHCGISEWKPIELLNTLIGTLTTLYYILNCPIRE